MRAPLDFDVYMKLPSGCGSKTGQVVRLDRALYGVKEAGRQWAAHLCKTMVNEHDMERKSDPCVFRKVVDGVVELIAVVHVDDILVGGGKEACDELHLLLNKKFPTNNLGEERWYMRCAIKRDWKKDMIKITQ